MREWCRKYFHWKWWAQPPHCTRHPPRRMTRLKLVCLISPRFKLRSLKQVGITMSVRLWRNITPICRLKQLAIHVHGRWSRRNSSSNNSKYCSAALNPFPNCLHFKVNFTHLPTTIWLPSQVCQHKWPLFQCQFHRHLVRHLATARWPNWHSWLHRQWPRCSQHWRLCHQQVFTRLQRSTCNLHGDILWFQHRFKHVTFRQFNSSTLMNVIFSFINQ